MFHQISEYGLKKLDKLVSPGKVVISHVGDGEYSCNTFGNVFSSFSAALKTAKKASLSTSDIGIFENVDDGEKPIWYISNAIRESYESWYTMPKHAELTIETIDTDFNPGN